jgi:membrane protein implicated in regulation of membrane protease activity
VAWYWWVVAALVLGLVEIATVDLIFIMLAAGALSGAATALVTDSLVAQSLVAAAVSLLLLVAVRPVALRHLRQPIESRTGTAALVGRSALVLERVDAHDGRVKIGGEIWSARTYDPGSVLEPGTSAEVVRIDGAHAVVYPSEQ